MIVEVFGSRYDVPNAGPTEALLDSLCSDDTQRNFQPIRFL